MIDRYGTSRGVYMIHTSMISLVRSLRPHAREAGALVLVLGLLVSGPAGAVGGEKPAEAEMGSASGKDVIQRGAVIGDCVDVRFADVLEKPDRFADKTVVFQGTIAEVCQTKGCWMKVFPDSTEVGVRVTFKDYGFFVPKDSKGMWVRAEGVFHVTVWSKGDVDHLESDGARLVRYADGTATELSFVANGVEIRSSEKQTPATKADSGESSRVREN